MLGLIFANIVNFSILVITVCPSVPNFGLTPRLLLKSYVAASTCAVGVAVGLNKATSVSTGYSFSSLSHLSQLSQQYRILTFLNP